MADALGLLGDDLYVHLDEADSLATQNAEWSADDGEEVTAEPARQRGPARW